MPAPLTMPEGGDQNRAPQLLAIFWTQVPISLTFLCLRVYVRVSIRNFSYDDYTMIVTWVSRLYTHGKDCGRKG